MVLKEDEYLKYVGKFPRYYPSEKDGFEKNFEFQSLSYSVYRRFIELLYPATNHFFRKTSKHNYQQCLDLRGIEVGYLRWDSSIEEHGNLFLDCGKMALNLDKVPTNWIKLLVVTGNVYVSHCDGTVPDIKKLDFVKKNTELYFHYGFEEQLECLIHPGLETVWICDSLEFDHFLRFMKKLNVCQHLESIYIDNYHVESAAAFEQVKQQLEQLAGRHAQAQISYHLGYKKVFKIHENVLCHCPKYGVFVKDYNFEDLRRYD